MKKAILITIFLALLAIGMATAADPIPATIETQGITTSTSGVFYGTMTNTESVVWSESNLDLRNNPPLGQNYNIFRFPISSNYLWLELDLDFLDIDGVNIGDITLLAPERQSVMSYSESIIADNGYGEFNGVQALDTGNKVANQKNFASTEQFDFVVFSDAMGRATTSESLLLDLASQGSDARERFTCPFATGDEGYIPAYCNVYEMGSSFTGSQVSMVTRVSENHIAKSADVPTQVDYSVGLSGTGSVASWINTHVMEGRTGGHLELDNPLGLPVQANFLWNYDTGAPFSGPGTGFMQSVDLVYKEKTTISGVIESFSKSMSVQDAVRRL
ncbi:MAG TPA: hypothetical protein PK069_07685 [Methanolinea sp.]|nr:hypothetical protein [Methanolinea sp.]HQK55444.1 hypothetical protein [Methanolinea sp.]